MVKIGLLGCGTIGSGVVELLGKESCQKRQLSIEKILVRNLNKHNNKPYGHMLTDSFEDILKGDIDIVVEVMGGIDPAYFYVKQSLLQGRHVVTANKDLIARHGGELQKIAHQNGVQLLFEASVGGGIPIIKPLSESLAGNSITEIRGIVNGTTNYILSRMYNSGKSYRDALEEAQACGYAEADPRADVEGYDAARKLAILSSIAYQSSIDYEEMYIEGISGISIDDINLAKYLGYSIKLLAVSQRNGDDIMARVSPVMLKNTDPLAQVADAYNAIIVKGDAVGDVLFIGQGAGKLPTASAVLGDIIDIVKHNIGEHMPDISAYQDLPRARVDFDDCNANFFIRLKPANRLKAMDEISAQFQRFEFVFPDWIRLQGITDQNQIIFEVWGISERGMKQKIDVLRASGNITSILSIIRVEGEK
jgi:homoserine dehydrogenase